MKKQIELPSGNLGKLKRVNIELEMKAKHYDALTTSTEDHDEETVLSILTDLMDEDPYELAQIDLMYLFTLVKIASIGERLTVNTRCNNGILLKDGTYRVCGTKQSFTYSLAQDEDVSFFKGKLPQFSFEVDGKTEVFNLQLPTMASELALLEEMQASGKTRREVLRDDKAALTLYAKKRMVAHLVSNNFTPEKLLEAFENSTFKKVAELTSLVKELNNYGLVHKEVKCKCKECGGTYIYRLPLFFGLSL